MKCKHGHTMVPICEYHSDQDGKSYVKFECYTCGDKIYEDYWKYNASRQSGHCPNCGRKFWGRMVLKCGHCGFKLPRVLQKGHDLYQWNVHQGCGHVYTPEE